MGFKRYKLTISLVSVEKEVEIDFYSLPSRAYKNVRRFLSRYNSDDINYYTIRSL
jgi:hypothetical protein